MPGYEYGYGCETIGCQCKMTKRVDGAYKCIAHAPMHCDHCNSVNVSIRRIDERRRQKVVNCWSCKKLSYKPL